MSNEPVLTRYLFNKDTVIQQLKLSIYERAVIKNVRQKIWEDEFWGNVFNEKEKERQK